MLIGAINLLSPSSRAWLAAANQDTGEERVRSVPLARELSNNDDRRRFKLRDSSRRSGGPEDAWEDFLSNGRESRRSRVPVNVDYMGRRECWWSWSMHGC